MLDINFTPFPNLKTERLNLRRVVKEDVNEIFALRSDKETMKYIPRPLVKTEEDALAHIAMINEKIENNINFRDYFNWNYSSFHSTICCDRNVLSINTVCNYWSSNIYLFNCEFD